MHRPAAMNSLNFPDSINLKIKLREPLMTVPSFDLLGIRVHAMTRHDLVGTAARAVDDRATCIIANHNLHSLYLWRQEPKMREFYSLANYVNIDGMSLVLLGRLFGLPLKSKHRTNYIDLLPLLAEEAARSQWRVFYLGSGPGVAETAARTLRTRYPGLQIATRDGYFNTDQCGAENQSVLAEICSYAPDILMVGMGMPRQEIWIAENLKGIAAHAVLCCGGLMDLVAGEIPTAPRWLGPLGLEWLYRLFSEPARLWRRYLVEPWVILIRATNGYFRSGHLSIAVETSTHE
jgi:N-acetylglucosaminyldiphosphoundecaprenol N-acetyl-beta-D-mannosaminyltransferase